MQVQAQIESTRDQMRGLLQQLAQSEQQLLQLIERERELETNALASSAEINPLTRKKIQHSHSAIKPELNPVTPFLPHTRRLSLSSGPRLDSFSDPDIVPPSPLSSISPRAVSSQRPRGVVVPATAQPPGHLPERDQPNKKQTSAVHPAREFLLNRNNAKLKDLVLVIGGMFCAIPPQ